MTPLLNRHQIRLNLIDLVAESLNETPDPSVDAFRTMLTIYRTDTVRKMHGQDGSLEYLFDELKPGIRIAGSLMAEVQTEEAEALKGWYMGSQPRNMVQFYYNVLAETAFELSMSVMGIEARYPHLRRFFEFDREQYRKVHEEWQRQDAAEEMKELG